MQCSKLKRLSFVAAVCVLAPPPALCQPCLLRLLPSSTPAPPLCDKATLGIMCSSSHSLGYQLPLCCSVPAGGSVLLFWKRNPVIALVISFFARSTSLLSPNPSSLLSLCFSANPASSWIISTSFSFHILQSFYLNITMNCAPKLIPTKSDSGNCWATPLMLVFPQHSD